MTPHEINQAIAELLGWKWYRIGPTRDAARRLGVEARTMINSCQ